MKKYSCDGGTIMIGTKESHVCLPNGYGDGCHSVRVIKRDDDRKKFSKECGWTWLGTVSGEKFNVYSYDCLHGDEFTDKDNILYTLSGRYGVYHKKGNIVLEKWQ